MGSAPQPRIVPPANDADVMYEQFEEMMGLGEGDSRYRSVRAILLGLFAETEERPFVMKTLAGLAR